MHVSTGSHDISTSLACFGDSFSEARFNTLMLQLDSAIIKYSVRNDSNSWSKNMRTMCAQLHQATGQLLSGVQVTDCNGVIS